VRRFFAIFLVLFFVATGVAGAQVSDEKKWWHPDLKSAIDYAQHRQGQVIAFAVRTQHHFWGYNVRTTIPSASCIKAMILVAYLNLPDVRNRDLRKSDHDMLDPMIERSDDHATDKVFSHVGYSGLQNLASRVGMKNFSTGSHWGRSNIDAEDQSLFLLHIDDFIPKRHRAAAMHLLASVIAEQRWGIAQVSPYGWDLYFKSGWGAGTGWVDSQVALLKRGKNRVGVALLTHNVPSHSYGKETLRGLAQRLLRGLADAVLVE
jgi:beta-lactamase class A